jgi:hypothetical protein
MFIQLAFRFPVDDEKLLECTKRDFSEKPVGADPNDNPLTGIFAAQCEGKFLNLTAMLKLVRCRRHVPFFYV